MYKKFALNLTNVALPNLIAHDLVLVYPMASMSGYVNYLEYTLGSNKGQSKQGDVVNSVFGLGTTRDGESIAFDSKYTSAQVTDTTAAATAGQTTFNMNWVPVIAGTVQIVVTSGGASTTYVDGGNGKFYSLAAGTSVSKVINPDGSLTVTLPAGATEAGTITYNTTDDETAGITFTAAPGENASVAVSYAYNNVTIPQNDLPILNVQMKSMPLIARARRIAVYYSQIAAFQAKTDYGFDLGDQLAEKAVGELSYEIDTEIVELLDTTAGDAATSLQFNKAIPVGISTAEHYEKFNEVVEVAKQIIYNRTKRFFPNYMLISSDIMPLLSFLRGWTAAPVSNVNGPYYAGTLNGLKVFVSPALASGRFLLGVNGSDAMSTVAVYAPYMPIVPTQLLGFADGAMSQGWSTLYDLKVLNANLIVAGSVYTDTTTANEQVISTKVAG